MITCNLRGQTSNQLFQVATVIATALRNNTTYCFPSRSGRRQQFPFMFPHLPINDFVILPVYKERQFGTYDELPYDQSLRLQGYFQSERYFAKYKKELLTILELPVYEQSPSVSIHVRRGDYLRLQHKYCVPTMDYFSKAIATFEDDSCKFTIFTDDLPWCRHHFKGNMFEFNEEQDPILALCQMAACKHHICVNSSFSWWGAWLGEEGQVIIPHKDQWFTDAFKHRLSTEDIIPTRWTQLKY